MLNQVNSIANEVKHFALSSYLKVKTYQTKLFSFIISSISFSYNALASLASKIISFPQNVINLSSYILGDRTPALTMGSLLEETKKYEKLVTALEEEEKLIKTKAEEGTLFADDKEKLCEIINLLKSPHKECRQAAEEKIENLHEELYQKINNNTKENLKNAFSKEYSQSLGNHFKWSNALMDLEEIKEQYCQKNNLIT